MAKKNWHEQCQGKNRFWQAHVHAWAKSGLAQNEYCKRNGLSHHQLGYWKKKFAKEDGQEQRLKFVPVPVASTVHSPLNQDDSGVSVVVNDIQVRLANHFNSETLIRTVRVLGGGA